MYFRRKDSRAIEYKDATLRWVSQCGEMLEFASIELRNDREVVLVAVSNDGKYLAVGERGHMPCITIWDIESGDKLQTLSAHKHGISCMAFSLLGEYFAKAIPDIFTCVPPFSNSGKTILTLSAHAFCSGSLSILPM